MQTRQRTILETIDNLMELAPDHPSFIKFRNTPKTPEQEKMGEEIRKSRVFIPTPNPDSGNGRFPDSSEYEIDPRHIGPNFNPYRPKLPGGRSPGGRSPGAVPMPNPNRPGRPEYRPGFDPGAIEWPNRPGKFPGNDYLPGGRFPGSRSPGGRFPGPVPMPNPNRPGRPGRPEYRPGFGDRPGDMGPAYPPSRLPGGRYDGMAYPPKPGGGSSLDWPTEPKPGGGSRIAYPPKPGGRYDAEERERLRKM